MQERFDGVAGVVGTTVGYTGGDGDSLGASAPPPTYASVCAGDGHSEAIRVEYDPAVVSYEELLEVFWGAHDGRARAPAQYASHAFATPAQREAAGAFLARKAEDSPRPVATTIREPQTFHSAEWYHQSYKKKNRARIALVVASLAVGALPAGMGFAGQEALRQALLGAAVVSTLPQLLSSVFDPLFDALERR